jgi:hypothetical protein
MKLRILIDAAHGKVMIVLNRRVGYLFHRPAAEAQDPGLPISNIYPNSQSSITGLDLS